MSPDTFTAVAVVGAVAYVGFIAFFIGRIWEQRKLSLAIDRMSADRDEARKLAAAAERELLLINIERDAARRLVADFKRHTGALNGSHVDKRI